MTQAELWQLQLLAVSNGITAFGVLLTLISGYLVTAARRRTRRIHGLHADKACLLFH